jgi:YebC/PmpR family DNA-binding regulatory protein
MSGHSKWASIKHKKGAVDAKRGKLFTKLVRELTIAAKAGGGVPENNPRLRAAIDAAKAANMPSDNVKKAIARGTGEIPGVVYEEVSYEGYGPAGVAVYCTGSTDNKNRTTSEIRKIFSDSGGNLGTAGCVAWMFHAKGHLRVEKSAYAQEEKLMELAIEAGGEDFKNDDEDAFDIFTAPTELHSVKAALEAAKVPVASAESTMLPDTLTPVSGEEAQKTLTLLDALEGHDDVTDVFANCDIHA